MLFSRTSVILLSAAAALALGCSSNSDRPDQPQAQAQSTFATPEQAVDALDAATRDDDRGALQRIFGPEGAQLRSGDPHQDELDYQRFAAAFMRKHALVPQDDGSVMLHLGLNDWEFPVPLVRAGDRWRFDTAAGIDDVTDRRIGKNELDAIASCQFYVDAQQAYFNMDPDGDSVHAYATRVRSSPGMHDGLYWPDEDGKPLSPLGPLFARAIAAGEIAAEAGPRPYRGYYYKVLTRQGPAAPGGAKDYVDPAGHMTGGFALIAWPAAYGRSGIMSFMVGPDGVVYQCDLSEGTADLARSMTAFDPGDSWTPVDMQARRERATTGPTTRPGKMTPGQDR